MRLPPSSSAGIATGTGVLILGCHRLGKRFTSRRRTLPREPNVAIRGNQEMVAPRRRARRLERVVCAVTLQGFTMRIPTRWSRPWVGMWLACSAALLVLAFFIPLWPQWVVATIPLFFLPELISIRARHDAYPPLTHTIRHVIPNWFAFPVIYDAGVNVARANRPSQLLIQRRDGTIEDERTYGDDPYPPKG